MQSNKASKKTRKITEENLTTAPNSGTAEAKSKPRTSRSSQSKVDHNEIGPAKHRKASSPSSSESVANKSTTAPKALAASAAAAGSDGNVSSIDVSASQVAVAPKAVSPTDIDSSATVPHEEIALLAHHYWIARGSEMGSAEQDWFRAEQELKARRSRGW